MASNRAQENTPPEQARNSLYSTDRTTKLPRLPQGSKIRKMTVDRRQQSASSRTRPIHVSTSTPFMAVISRVRKELDKCLQSQASGPSTRGLGLAQRVELLHRSDAARGSNCEVLVRGTGRAIEKTLQAAGWFMAHGDYEIDIRTRTVDTVDVVESSEGPSPLDDERRVRRMNCFEVAVRLK